MNLPSELAILEACETGLGAYHQGEGVMNLARGFTYAGCQSVLMSLWNVSETNSTDKIMEGFYNHLADSLDRDEAITMAKRDFLEQSRDEGAEMAGLLHPFYWSELVLIGERGPLHLARKQATGTWIWIVVAVLGIGCALGIFRWRRRGMAAMAAGGKH